MTSGDAKRQLQPNIVEIFAAPQSIAVVGASPMGSSTNYYGARLFENLVASGTTALLHPINPNRAGEVIHGLQVFASLAALPEPPDIVVIVTPPHAVVPALHEAGRAGVKVAVVCTAHHGSAMEQSQFDAAIGALAIDYGMPIIGPNSMGVLHGQSSLCLSFTSGVHSGGLRGGNVAVLAQSGSVIAALIQEHESRSLGYTLLASTGNEVSVSTEGLLSHLADDAETGVVLLYIEAVSDGLAFREAALRARGAGKAVVMFKVGNSESGQQAVLSHTGRIAGDRDIYEAVASECGIVMADSYEQFFDSALALSASVERARGSDHRRRAAVITTSGGIGTYVADELSRLGWALADFRPDIATNIASICGVETIGHPVDVPRAFAEPDRIGRIVKELGRDEAIDAIIVATSAGGHLGGAVAQVLVTAAAGASAEVYVSWIALTAELRRVFDESRIPVYPDPRRAVWAAESSAVHRSHLATPVAQRLTEIRSLRFRPEALDEALHRDATVLPTEALLRELSTNGITCLTTAFSTDLSEKAVQEATRQVGYPLVLKLDSPDLSHKSDVAGVVLNVGSDTQASHVAAGFRAVASAHAFRQGRVAVQAMTSGIEVLLGVKRDPSMGWMLVLGTGGTKVELRPDVVKSLLPVDRDQSERLLQSHRTLAALLAGYRGGEKANVNALLSIVENASSWVVARTPKVEELDLNPIVVNANGAFVIDARMVQR